MSDEMESDQRIIRSLRRSDELWLKIIGPEDASESLGDPPLRTLAAERLEANLDLIASLQGCWRAAEEERDEALREVEILREALERVSPWLDYFFSKHTDDFSESELEVLRQDIALARSVCPELFRWE